MREQAKVAMEMCWQLDGSPNQQPEESTQESVFGIDASNEGTCTAEPTWLR